MLVGNKSDIVGQPGKSPKSDIPFVVTSAKNGTNILRCFQGMTQMVLDKIKSGKIDPDKVTNVIFRLQE